MRGPAPVTLSLKVVPGASRSGIVGWLGGALKVRVAAPPERGKANAAVQALLADRLGIAPESVRIVAGHGSPRKKVAIAGLTAGEIQARLAAATE